MKKITVALILFALVLTACASLGAKAKDEANKEPVIVFHRERGFRRPVRTMEYLREWEDRQKRW